MQKIVATAFCLLGGIVGLVQAGEPKGSIEVG
jgi:hypothetical protein